MTKTISIVILLLAVSYASTARADEAAQRAFQQLQTLAGDWDGQDDAGHAVKTTFALAVSNTALLETLKMPDGYEMLTVYSVDQNTIALLHYCPTNNQPQMRAIPPDGAVRNLTFEFQRAGNLANLDIGHERKLVIQFQDRDHITERWTWHQNGRDQDSVYRFARKARTRPWCLFRYLSLCFQLEKS